MRPETIVINTEPRYLPEQSKPDQNRFVFAYTITIENTSTTRCQLLSRHWVIQDANHKVEEVTGDGVIGEQPVLEPGESYTYSSGAIIETEIGTMEGRYFMVWQPDQTKDPIEFEALIPRFTLSIPRTVH